MNKMKFLMSLVLALSLLVAQAGTGFAAADVQKSTLITGTIQSITLETDPNTGITTVIVEVTNKNHATQTLRISQTDAATIGLISLDGDGNPVINKLALGKLVEIDPATAIPDRQQDRHPVGNALVTFFADKIPGLDYKTIMNAHDQGLGFGVIAQALWLTQEVGGDSQIFQALLLAKQSNDYTKLPFVIADQNGTIIIPKNWGQLRKVILAGNKIVKAASKPDNTNNPDKKNNQDKNKGKDKNHNSNGNGGGGGNGAGNGNGNGAGNGNGNGAGNGNKPGNGNNKEQVKSNK